MTGRLGHYTLLDQAGAGGMGVVYRARDERLERDVALKLLPPGLIHDPQAGGRLAREARALSQLNHPNIAAVYALESEGSSDFIVMEWVPGTTLDARPAGTALGMAELLSLATQAAEALAAAHAAGVAHRDLKPGNLRVTPEGRLKLLDFGLARRVRFDELAPTLSSGESGAAAGTLAYMPPEAFAGLPGDAQGDLYSLGVVLYELATGRLPFAGDTAAQLLHAILHSAVAPPRALNPALSPGFEAVVLELLERDRARRCPTAREFLSRLARAGGAGPAAAARPERPAVAVLPLVNLSGDPSEDYFADGMTEALIGDLARLRELRVISRTSVMRYKGAQLPISAIAAQLNVESILEGSVLRAGERVRVSVQLIEARTDTHLWAGRYDRSLEDVLALQSEVAESVAKEIRGTLLAPAAGTAPREAVPARRMDPEAYDAYLRGRHQLNRRSDVSLRRAADFFQSAIARDPGHAMAHTGLAEAHALIGFHEFAAADDAFPRALAAAARALEIHPELGEALAVRAYVELHYDRDWPAAERDFLRAIELEPNLAVTRLWYVNLLIASGRFAECDEHIRRALELDPLSLILNMVHGWMRFFEGRYQEAFDSMERALELEPNFFQAHAWRGWALASLGRRGEAAVHMESAAGLIQHEPTSRQCGALARAFAGELDAARDSTRRLEALREERHVAAFAVALCHEAIGDHERAIAWLERARDERSPWIGFLRVDRRFDALRGHPRFEPLLALPGGPG